MPPGLDDVFVLALGSPLAFSVHPPMALCLTRLVYPPPKLQADLRQPLLPPPDTLSPLGVALFPQWRHCADGLQESLAPNPLWGERPPADCSTLVAAAVQLHLQSRRSNNIPGAPRGTIESTLGSSVHYGRCAAEDATRVRAAPRQRHGAAERATRLRAAWTTTPGGRIVRCLAFSAV